MSPNFHRWHHTSEDEGLDKNFAGLFPAWDALCGTCYMPPGPVPIQCGLGGKYRKLDYEYCIFYSESRLLVI